MNLDKGKISLGTVVNFILLSFPILVAFGSYKQINSYIIIVYLAISLFLLVMKNDGFTKGFVKNKLSLVWTSFIALTFFSTIFMKRTGNIITSLNEICVFLIVYILTRYWNPKKYLIYFKNIILVLSIISIVGYIFNIDFFSVLKSGTVYYSVDLNVGGGISTIFEYRHFYGVFLTISLIIQYYFSFHNIYLDFFVNSIFLFNVLLTYTRNIWVTLVICFFFLLIKHFRPKLKVKYIVYFYLVLFAIVLGVVFLKDSLSTVIINSLDRILAIFDYQSTSTASVPIFGGVRGYTLIYGTRYIFTRGILYILFGGGSGFALNWLEQNPYNWWDAAIDNQYVTILMDTGIAGLLLIILMFSIILSSFWKSKDSLQSVFSLSLIALFIAMYFFELLGTMSSAFVVFNIFVCGLLGNNRTNYNFRSS
ncbi:O-antigen ligase family protein [Enterococcus sp. LJL90]